jgi:iron-sulfur cluster assembly accessory protein
LWQNPIKCLVFIYKKRKGTIKTMISISDKARVMLQKEGADEQSFVRVIVHTGGCAGMTYDAEIDRIKRKNEKTVQKDQGITIISDDASLPFLDGLSIDYSDDLISAGFRFNNSSNESSCGCGASFSLTPFPNLENGGLACGS